MAVVSGVYDVRGEREELLWVFRGRSKSLKRNEGVLPHGDRVGLFHLVMIAPSDIELIKGGEHGRRRRFMDQILLPRVEELYDHNTAI